MTIQYVLTNDVEEIARFEITFDTQFAQYNCDQSAMDHVEETYDERPISLHTCDGRFICQWF